MNKNLRTLGILALGAILSVSSVFGQGMSSARTVALGAAGTALATGIDAYRYNPANLGIASFRQSGIELVGVGANVTNNAFTLSDYNKYSGAFLTSDDKADILNKVPKEGLKFTAEADATAMAIAMGPTVLAVSGVGAANVNLNRDLLELALNGNTFADTINVTGSYSEAIGYGAASLSYGFPIYSAGSRQLAVGATAKYIYGLGIEEVTEMEGLAATYATGFQGEGHMVARTATGGSGYGVDLGATLKLNNDYVVGGRIKNFVSSITWNKQTEEHGYLFSFDTMTVDNMNGDYVVSDDYTKSIPNFTTNLPSTLNLGLANISGRLLWAIDWEQGFRTAPGSSSKPRLSCGVEYGLLGVMPLRAGYSTGGNRNSAFSFGSGFHLPVFFIDYAVVTGSSLSGYSSKGVNFALTTGLHF
ncbi:MAG TPA: DUF5723 family protein [candidate division Zixibacteria bacterium]|nr:DUF5723 family protein [candidate division Zixibacteria bacterium]